MDKKASDYESEKYETKTVFSFGPVTGGALGFVAGGILGAGIVYFITKDKGTTETSGLSSVQPTPPSTALANVLKDLGENLKCPISHGIMADPVATPYGYTYDRKIIEDFIDKFGIDPNAKQPLTKEDLIPNYLIQNMLDQYF